MTITAEEARKISETNLEKHLRDVFSLIEQNAYAGKRKVKLTDNFWNNDSTVYWAAATERLKELGFRVWFYREKGWRDPMSCTVVEW